MNSLNIITSSSNRLNILKSLIPSLSEDWLELLNVTNVPFEIQNSDSNMVIVSDALDTTEYIYNAYAEALTLWLYSVMYNKEKTVNNYIDLLKQKIDFTGLDIKDKLHDFLLNSMLIEGKYKPSDYLKGNKKPLETLVVIMKDILDTVKDYKTPVLIHSMEDLELFIKNDFILNDTSFRKIIFYVNCDLVNSFKGLMPDLKILRLYTSGFDYNTQKYVENDENTKTLFLGYESNFNKYSRKLSMVRYLASDFNYYASIKPTEETEKEYTEFVNTLLKSRCVYGSINEEGSIDVQRLVSNNIFLMQGMTLPSFFGSEFIDTSAQEFESVSDFMQFIKTKSLSSYKTMKEELNKEVIKDSDKINEFINTIYFENSTLYKWITDAESVRNNLDDKEPMYFKGLINHIFKTYQIVTDDIYNEIFSDTNAKCVVNTFNTNNKMLVTNILRTALDTFYKTNDD